MPPGNNVPVVWTLDLTSAFLVDAEAGGNLSFRFYATGDQVGYLFNARSFAANRPLITVTAVPEPSSGALLAGGLALTAMGRTRKQVKESRIHVDRTSVGAGHSGGAGRHWDSSFENIRAQAQSAQCVSSTAPVGGRHAALCEGKRRLSAASWSGRTAGLSGSTVPMIGSMRFAPISRCRSYRELYESGQAPKPGARTVFVCPLRRFGQLHAFHLLSE